MRFRDLLYETWAAIDANRGRSLLTVIGIVIGISAVIAVMALIGGIQQALVSELGLNQSRLIEIMCTPGRNVTLDDLDNIAAALPDYEYVTGAVSGTATATSGTKSTSVSVTGVKAEYFGAMGNKVAQGRFFTDAEYRNNAMSVMLDQGAVRALFGDANADVVGKTIRIGNDEYAVVGVVESSGLLAQYASTVYLPFNTAVVRVTGGPNISQIYGVAKEGADLSTLSTATTDYLVKYFDIPEADRETAVYVQSMKSVTDQLDTTMTSFQALMAVVAGVSLLVGGVGIMNMMLTNVTERIREIGLRKALGARASDISRQFLLEAIVVCLAGGIIGIAVGYLFAYILAGAVSGMASGLSVTPVITPGAVILAAGICVGIGIVFGVYPAKRAARLDPVESLHYQ